MPITKPSLNTEITCFEEVLAQFASGDLYVGYGGLTESEANSAFFDRQSMDELVNSKMVKIADLAEKPGKTESKVEQLKTCNYTLPGKRTNNIELSLVGINPARKQWLEEGLNKQNVTFVLLDKTKDSALVFNNHRWVCNWGYELEGFFTATILTEYSGPTATGFMIFKDIPNS